jgi:hypothetical protein
MVLPAITESGNDMSYEYGLKKLFWFGRSNYSQISINNTTNFANNNDAWMSYEGW